MWEYSPATKSWRRVSVSLTRNIVQTMIANLQEKNGVKVCQHLLDHRVKIIIKIRHGYQLLHALASTFLSLSKAVYWEAVSKGPLAISNDQVQGKCYSSRHPFTTHSNWLYHPWARWNTTSKQCGFGRGGRSPKFISHHLDPALGALCMKSSLCKGFAGSAGSTMLR